MYMHSFTIQLFTAAFLATTTIVWSFPMQRRQTIPRTAHTTFKVSKEAVDQLTDIRDESVGLVQLWRKAHRLTNEAWLSAEVRNLIIMRMRIFHVNYVVSTSATQSMQRSRI